ncbi:protein EDS1L-like isoform X2 [Phragmites australis]|uniref:protein EDS1L-like isoform X2 n=1 Tax=Phragmites australis TaxID=29695 RepID=UPI002D77135D|nr:protein EDS1L-like isoform X2 [Phragmites australis]
MCCIPSLLTTCSILFDLKSSSGRERAAHLGGAAGCGLEVRGRCRLWLWGEKAAGSSRGGGLLGLMKKKVSRAVAEEKRVVFTGHSSGGSIATLAAIWFLEKCTKRGSVNQAHPFCVTFGAPLIGDNIFNHAVRREGWSQCILHFLLPLDIVPRIPLTPLASFREEIQAVLDWLSPQTPNNSPVGRSFVIPAYYETSLRSALSIASYEACSFMGCTSSILGTLTSFIELSPYRPCGTYLFLTSSEQLIVLTNSDAVLQLLFYCLQLDPQQQLLDAAARSLSAHWQYEPIKQCIQDIICVDYLGTFSSALPGRQSDRTAIGSVELSKEAILHLSAAAQWEKQKQRNQKRIDDKNCKNIQEALKSLNEYKRTCELHGVSYYDSFKVQREVHDFNANVRRLELAGLWDEIVEMLRRRELPDGFEAREEWVSLGTLYRRLVEPLDIANYYRHSKNEDTGPYLSKGRPRRYKYTQKWHEQLRRIPSGSSLESCFWAMVEELQAEMTDGRAFEDLRDRVVKLESDAHGWLTSGSLGNDVLLSSSSFVMWWKTLPEQHRSASCILKLMSQ